MKWNSRIRCALVCLAFTALFSVFSFRLVDLQLVKHDEYAALAAERNGYKQTIYADRGTIVDANNEVLAHNVPDVKVAVDTTLVNNVAKLTPLLAQMLDLPVNEVAGKLNSGRPYVVLKSAVAQDTAKALGDALLTAKLRGILLERDPKRHYPNGPMLCHVIGFTDFEHKGIQGIELSMDEYLRGQNGYRLSEHNRKGRELVPYRGQECAPRDGDARATNGRSQPAKHRRERDRCGDARIHSREGDHYPDATQDR